MNYWNTFVKDNGKQAVATLGVFLIMGLLIGCGEDIDHSLQASELGESSSDASFELNATSQVPQDAQSDEEKYQDANPQDAQPQDEKLQGSAFAINPNDAGVVTLKCGKSRYANTPSRVKRRAKGATIDKAKEACRAKLDGVANFNTRCNNCDCTQPDTCYPQSKAVNVTYPGGCKDKSITIFGTEFKWVECTCSSRRFRYSCTECQEPFSKVDSSKIEF